MNIVELKEQLLNSNFHSFMNWCIDNYDDWQLLISNETQSISREDFERICDTLIQNKFYTVYYLFDFRYRSIAGK